MIATATSAGFAIHGVIILIACVLAAVTTLGRVKPTENGGWIIPETADDRYHDGGRQGRRDRHHLLGHRRASGGRDHRRPALLAGAEPRLEWTSFGRLRPLHTSAVIFAFGGNALIATSFWVVQRTCRAQLFAPGLAWFVFWGYQLFIVLAATGYLLGITQSKEYAEPEWYVDLWLTIVWVAYLLVYVGTIVKRREPHIYVANWFYLAFIITIAMLHIVNNLAVPAGFGPKSYPVWAACRTR